MNRPNPSRNIPVLALLLALLTLTLVVRAARPADARPVLPDDIVFLVSPIQPGEVPGPNGPIVYVPEDILRYQPSTQMWSLFFKGEDFGIPPGSNVDAALLVGNNLILSLEFPATLPGIPGFVVMPEDLLRVQLTTGVVSLLADMSDVGLGDTGVADEGLDAITVGPTGTLLANTKGPFAIPAAFGGVSGNGGDVLSFAPTQWGFNTQGMWTLFFDGPGLAPRLPAAPLYEIVGLTLACDGNWYVALANGPQGPGIYLYTPGGMPPLTLVWAGTDGFDGSFIDSLIVQFVDCARGDAALPFMSTLP